MRWDGIEITFAVLIIDLIALIGVIFFIAVTDTDKNKRLMQQCMADCKKEYECHALLEKQ